MPEVEKLQRQEVLFQIDLFQVREQPNGSVNVCKGTAGFYLVNKDEKDNFVALIRAYLAHIDVEAAHA